MTYSAKLLWDRPDPEGKGKNPRKQAYEVEVDGLGNFETVIAVPATTANLKDAEKRAEKIKAILDQTIQPDLAAMGAAHAG